jgi:DNA-binding response OmpR family regulator
MVASESAHIWHPEAAHDDNEEPATTPRPKRIVHVEDDEDLRSICGEILHDAGFEVLGCPNLASARIAIEARVPDLLLLDRDLPDGSGLDLARWVRNDPACSGVLIVAFSGRKDKDEIEHAILAGCDAFIGKPCGPEMLVETLKALVCPEPDAGRHWTGVRRKVAAAAP